MTPPLMLFLQPVDVWLFRDGRPFDAGSAHRAESMFPPYPTVIQGAIRTHQLTLDTSINLGDKSKENKKKIADRVGGPDDFGKLRLRGPFLARREKGKLVRYFPQPADAIVNGKSVKFAGYSENIPDTLKTSQPLSVTIGLKDKSGKQAEPLWLSQPALVAYLAGESVEGVEADELFERENRTGIGIGAGRVVNEGMLYEAGFIRPKKDVGLLVEMEGYTEPEWQKPGVLHLGGEKRMAYFSSEPVDPFPPVQKATGRFKVFFATPAYFENGWKPTAWEKFFAAKVELVAAAINHYEIVGGFNWAVDPEGSSAHRPARRFVPAGSVYYFKGIAQLNPDLIQQAITDIGAEIGFGQTIIKEW